MIGRSSAPSCRVGNGSGKKNAARRTKRWGVVSTEWELEFQNRNSSSRVERGIYENSGTHSDGAKHVHRWRAPLRGLHFRGRQSSADAGGRSAGLDWGAAGRHGGP